MSYELVQRALEARLKAYADAAGVKVAWENFDEDWSGEFLRPFFLPAEPAPASIGVDGEDMLRGIFQVSIYRPLNEGLRPATARVDALIQQFGRGTQLTADALTVTCSRTWPAPAFRSGDSYAIPVSVSWFAYARN